jgi:hypothetical protein
LPQSAQIVPLLAKVWNKVEPMPITTTHQASILAKVPVSYRRTCRTPHSPAAMKARLVKALAGSAQSLGPVRSQ